MTSLLLAIKKALEAKADGVGKKILDGSCSTWEDYKARVAERKAFLGAIDIMNETAKKADEAED